jgi:hypothetical protein
MLSGESRGSYEHNSIHSEEVSTAQLGVLSIPRRKWISISKKQLGNQSYRRAQGISMHDMGSCF